jgi:hypothetical protein
MSSPIGINTLVTKPTSVLSAVTTAPTKGTPVVDLMSYQIIASMMFLNWQYQEDVIASAGTFTAVASTNIFTKSSHGFRTGIKVRVSNSGGAIPTGLAALTDYYVIKIDANTFYLSTTLLGALNGSAIIDITTNGTGTNTVTPQAVAGTAGSGIYLLEVPDGYEIDSSFISIGTDTHANIVGRCSVIDSAGTPVDLYGYVIAYDSTHLAMVVNKAFVSSTNLSINATDKPVKYSLQAAFPVKSRNYLY